MEGIIRCEKILVWDGKISLSHLALEKGRPTPCKHLFRPGCCVLDSLHCATEIPLSINTGDNQINPSKHLLSFIKTRLRHLMSVYKHLSGKGLTITQTEEAVTVSWELPQPAGGPVQNTWCEQQQSRRLLRERVPSSFSWINRTNPERQCVFGSAEESDLYPVFIAVLHFFGVPSSLVVSVSPVGFFLQMLKWLLSLGFEYLLWTPLPLEGSKIAPFWSCRFKHWCADERSAFLA